MWYLGFCRASIWGESDGIWITFHGLFWPQIYLVSLQIRLIGYNWITNVDLDSKEGKREPISQWEECQRFWKHILKSPSTYYFKMWWLLWRKCKRYNELTKQWDLVKIQGQGILSQKVDIKQFWIINRN